LCVYLAALAAALAATPAVIRLSWRLRVLDRPGLRKVHSRPIPRLGGLAIAAAALGATAVVIFLDNAIGAELRRNGRELAGLLAGACLMLAVGLWDDLRGLRPGVKLLGQIISALLVCAAGAKMDVITIGRLATIHLGWLSWPLTVLWIVGVTNALNLIDGLDGLAAGISAVACGVIAAFALASGQVLMAVLMLGMLGSLCGFLVFNFNPARIFMGDGGTYFLGFVLGSGSVVCASKTATLVGLTLPALALGLPIFDTLFSMLRRFAERRSIFSPDRGHIHHRLLAMGLNHRRAVILLYAVTVTAASLGLCMLMMHGGSALLAFACEIVLVTLVFRAVGLFNVRKTLAAIRRNWGIARQQRSELRTFEKAELMLRETGTFDQWWSAACSAAEELGFDSISMAVRNRDGSQRILSWQRETLAADVRETVLLSLPVRDRRSGPPLRAYLNAPAEGNLESVGRRSALLGRIFDEHSPADLPDARKAG
jgi:UDP-GlcNAc:undecaprenyl-phosphate GlcNAc-1-phosphate transferase